MNGAPASLARRRAISVFPTPVGPMRMMLFGRDLFADRLGRALPAPPVAQRDRDGLLRVGLADDVAIELRGDLRGRQVGEPGEGLLGAIGRHLEDAGAGCGARVRTRASLAASASTVASRQASRTVIFVFV